MGLKVVLTSRDWFFGSFHVSSPVRPVSFSGLRDPRPRRSFTCSRGSWARFSLITSVHAGSRSVLVGFPRHLRFRPKTPDFASRTCPAMDSPVTGRGLRDSRASLARFSLHFTCPSVVRKSGFRESSVFGHRSPHAKAKTADFASRTCVLPWSVRALLPCSGFVALEGREGNPFGLAQSIVFRCPKVNQRVSVSGATSGRSDMTPCFLSMGCFPDPSKFCASGHALGRMFYVFQRLVGWT